MTKQEAVRRADRRFGLVDRYGAGSDQWAFMAYSEAAKAWEIPNWRSSYITACIRRAEAVAAEAVRILFAEEGFSDVDGLIDGHASRSRGRVAERVSQILLAMVRDGHPLKEAV